MNAPPAPISVDPEPYKAALRALRLWLVELAAWLIDAFGENRPVARWAARAARPVLNDAARDLKHALLGLALARFLAAAPPRRKRTTTRPRSHAPGCRIGQARASLVRTLTRGALPGLAVGPLRARIVRLRHILENPDAAIARLLKRFARGIIGARRVLTGPPPIRFASGAPAPTPAGADTS